MAGINYAAQYARALAQAFNEKQKFPEMDAYLISTLYKRRRSWSSISGW